MTEKEIILEERINSPEEEIVVSQEIFKNKEGYVGQKFAYECESDEPDVYNGTIADIVKAENTDVVFLMERSKVQHSLCTDKTRAENEWIRWKIKSIHVTIYK